jgi:hypothetical protein
MLKFEDLKTGDYVKGRIKGNIVVGRILILKSRPDAAYFLQNRFNGGKPNQEITKEERELLSLLPFSWVFTAQGNRFSQTVSDLEYISQEEFDAFMEANKSSYHVTATEGVVKVSIGNEPSTTICRYNNHSDCCGAKILYGFCESDTMEYSRYSDLEKEVFQSIRTALLGDGRACIAHLAHYQEVAIQLLLDLGFREIDSFSNPNSGNEVYVFHFTTSDLDKITESLVTKASSEKKGNGETLVSHE